MLPLVYQESKNAFIKRDFKTALHSQKARLQDLMNNVVLMSSISLVSKLGSQFLWGRGSREGPLALSVGEQALESSSPGLGPTLAACSLGDLFKHQPD